MELLERERYLAELQTWLDDATRGTGQIVLIGGEAGVGKTTLLRQFAASQRGTRVLWGACDDLFTPRPLGPLHDIAEQAQEELRLAVASGARREDLFTATLRELQQQPTLAVFEDLHWADEATLDLLKYLGRRVVQTRALIAITYRDDEVGPRHPLRFVMGDLPRATTHKLSLESLSAAAVAQLARQAGRPSQGIYEVTGGNPLFVTEVLATGATDIAGSAAIPANIRDAVLGRAVKLSPAARELAELVCVVPGKVEAWLVADLSQAHAAAVEACLAIGMLQLDDGSFAYRHELVRRAWEDSLPAQRKVELHAAILAVLARRPGTPAARLAHHANGANDSGSVTTFAPFAAAQAAALGAHREASSHFEAALRHAAALPPPTRAKLQEQLSYEYYLTDRTDKALDARHQALAIWQATGARTEEGNALRWISRLSWFEGRGADAERFAAAAIETLESLPPGRELAMAYSNLAQLKMLAHDSAAAITWAKRAIALAEATADREILSHALNNLGAAELIAGDELGWQHLEQSLQLALEEGLQEHVARAYTNLSSNAVGQRRYPAAARYFQDGIGYCDRHDLDSWRLYMLAWRARLRLETGEWAGAGADAEAVVLHPGTAPVSRIPALVVLSRLRRRRGDPEADPPLREAMALAEPTQELQRLGDVAVALAEDGETMRTWEGAEDFIRRAYALASRLKDPWVAGELAVALWRAQALETLPTEVAAPFALELSGDWRAAADAWSALGCPYDSALLKSRHGAQADQLAALAVLEQLGATPAALALRQQMRATGVRGIPRGARASTRDNSHGLTRRESEILTLMAAGLKNAAIAKKLHVSPRTVDHHVSAILSKLGVTSRAEAIALAAPSPQVR